jgi:hypothetical protein
VTVNWRKLRNKESHVFILAKDYWEIHFIVVELGGENDKQCCGK